jgi:hypothetical protein
MTVSAIGPGRAVEVLHDRGLDRWTAGSGYLIGSRLVLTAAHNVDYRRVLGEDEQLLVRTIGGSELAAAVVLVCDEVSQVDLALLEVSDPLFGEHLPPVTFAQVNRDSPMALEGCWAVGFPRFVEAGPVLPGGSGRDASHIRGEILPGGKRRAGLLSLQVTSTPRAMLTGSAWEGMSGAVVFAADADDGEPAAVGVISTHHLPEGESALTVVPVTAITGVAAEAKWWQQLGVTDPSRLPVLPRQRAQPGSGPTAQRDRLGSYLAAARAAAARHPYTITVSGSPAAPALSSVYLRQQLGAQVDQALSFDAGGPVPGPVPVGGTEPAAGAGGEPAGGPGQEPTTGPGQESVARRPGAYANPSTGVTADHILDALHRFDIDDVLARNRGALIVGGPGSGKSSLLRHVIEVAADRWQVEGGGAFVPVLVHARSLLSSLPMNKAIAEALRQDLGALLGDIDLDDLLAGPPLPGLAWLIQLDGLDEISETEQRQQVIEIVGRWWKDPRYRWYRFVIASRPLEDRELYMLRTIGIPAFEIQTFSDDQLPILAAHWFDALGWPDAKQAAGLFMAQIRQARILQLARNPLIATISCVVFASNRERGLPYNRADLYEEFIESSLDNFEKMYNAGHYLASIKERVGRYGPQAIAAAETLARKMRSLMQDLAISRLTGSELDLRIEVEQLAEAYWPSGEPPKPWNDVVGELLVHSGLITARAGGLAFTHETIAEYLAAYARATPPRSGRLGVRERWQLRTRAGSNESYPLFVVALLRRQGMDLTRRPPAFLQMRKLLHARLVAALVHDGCERDLDPSVVAVVTERLNEIATKKTSGIPFGLRRGIWWQDDDCVMAAKALTLIDKDRGLELLFTLAADPTVPSFSIFDVLAEVMVMEDLTEIDSARGLSVLHQYASAPSPAGVDREEDSYNRMMIADLIMDRNAELGAELLRALAEDTSMDMTDRMDCIERLIDIDRQTAIEALEGIIIDTGTGLPRVLTTYSYLNGLDGSAAVAALAHVATDPARGGYSRAVASTVLYHAARPEGLRALRELSGDQAVPGFYRVHNFAEFGDPEERDSRFLALSRDTTLPAAWRAFAAEELSAHDRQTGIDALRAVQHDVSIDRRARTKLRMRAFLLERFPGPPALLARTWKPTARLLDAQNLAPEADGGPMSVRRYLLPHERLRGARRPHPVPLLAPLSFVLCGLVAAVVLSGLFPQGRDLAAIWALWGLLLLYLAWRVGAWSAEYLVLTDQRLLYTRGLIVRKVNMVPLGAIADMQFERPLFGLMFDCGTFSIASARWKMRLEYMPHPDSLYQDLFSLSLTGDV